MNQIRMSLVDNDFVIKAKTDIDINAIQNQELIKFFNLLKEELVIGETEFLTIEGLQKEPLSLRISETELTT